MKRLLTVLVLLVSLTVHAQKAPTKRVTTQAGDPMAQMQKYLVAAGLSLGDQWNAAFVYWCYNSFPGGNPLRKTGSGLEMWNGLSSQFKLTADEAKKEPNRILPGNIFFISESEKEVRVGIVVSVNNDEIETVEADTQVGGPTRLLPTETVIRKRRYLSQVDLGFSNFTDDSNPSTQKSAAK